MDQDRAFHVAHIFKVSNQMVEAMTIQRANVSKAQVFEERSRHDKGLEGFFRSLGELQHLLADRRDRFQETLYFLSDFFDGLARHDVVEIGRKRPDIGGNGHFIVVENNDEVFIAVPGPVQSLEGEAGGHGTVADDRDDLEVILIEIPGFGDARGGRNGRTAVADIKDVVDTFFPFRESA
ncbi:MAG: hypothetical protein A4E66_01644 [Syntrophus sp. PtaB.Bin001]|nr:MAG: hypothetical protein A4E66_01644 [Syntrophus sp. PtaB.Bin001]